VARAGKLAKPRPDATATSDADGSGELMDDRHLRDNVIREYWRILRGDIARVDIFFAEKVKAAWLKPFSNQSRLQPMQVSSCEVTLGFPTGDQLGVLGELKGLLNGGEFDHRVFPASRTAKARLPCLHGSIQHVHRDPQVLESFACAQHELQRLRKFAERVPLPCRHHELRCLLLDSPKDVASSLSVRLPPDS
jgi:hypothetical protein